MIVCSCDSDTRINADLSAYGDVPITISGLLDEDFTVTPNELAELDCIGMDESGETQNAGTITVTGPTLDTFLAEYGKTRDDFVKIRFYALDKYQITLKGKYLTDHDVVFSIACGDDPLPEGHQPLRLCILKAPSSYWIYAVIRIEFVTDD